MRLRRRVRSGPAWVWALLHSALFAVIVGGTVRVLLPAVPLWVVVVLAVPAGAALGIPATRLTTLDPADAGTTSARGAAEQQRAVMRGPVPTDPAARRAMHQQAVAEQHRLARWFWPAVVVHAGILAAGLSMIAERAALAAAAVLVGVPGLVATLWVRRRVRSRVAELDPDRPTGIATSL